MNKLISACMIVKNEEKVIERCLSSIKEYVDEIIIIDTGSTDRTREIASAFTNHIYDFEWINDFAAARNEGIRRATSQWIFVIDADEYFPPAEAAAFRRFLEQELPAEGVVYELSVVNLMGDSEQTSNAISTGEIPRLFPNHHDIYYTRPIHEQLYCLNGTSLRHKLAPGSLFHTGYLNETIQSKDKLTRNASIFSELKNKKGLSAYDYFTIGNEKGIQRDFQSAIYYFERSLKKGERESGNTWYPRCIIALTQAYLEEKRLYDAWSVVENKLSKWNAYPEYHSLKGLIYFQLGLFEAAAQESMEALQTAERLAEKTHVFWLDRPDYASTFPLRILFQIHSWEKDTEKSIYYLTKLLVQNPYDHGALTQLITILSQTQPVQDIGRLLEGVGSDLKYQLYLFKTSLTLGNGDLAAYFHEKLAAVASELNLFDQLNYALLKQNEADFETIWNQIHGDDCMQFDKLVTITLGSLVWGKDFLGQVTIPDDHALSQSYQAVRSIIQKESVIHHSHIYPLLTKSYLFQFYELYDQLVNTYNTPETINALANFFYTKKQEDLALNYYSLLLRNNELDATSLENLAMYHLFHNYIDDGLEFLLLAIEKRPDALRFYTLYLAYCTDADAKRNFIQKYGDKFSFYRKIPALAHLLR
ncbi:tetratricopeptide repeat-containing glycosyltransferase family 2 protein [Paenibacillus glycinis]|uniref:Glycosyltransferase n=1 Tax=Paenibacillus glycinis TaxID=2697035 RepID=A0ABW9XVJ6_9BACL|nr:glycosyltransferase family 2 protein [Paenibacillus glycinis]NBD26707.1 glycosyltransferase [Paenibacillus glycinis]